MGGQSGKELTECQQNLNNFNSRATSDASRIVELEKIKESIEIQIQGLQKSKEWKTLYVLLNA